MNKYLKINYQNISFFVTGLVYNEEGKLLDLVFNRNPILRPIDLTLEEAKKEFPQYNLFQVEF